MYTQVHFHKVVNGSQLEIDLEAAYNEGEATLAKLTVIADACEWGKRMLNDKTHWESWEKKHVPEFVNAQKDMYLATMHGARLALNQVLGGGFQPQVVMRLRTLAGQYRKETLAAEQMLRSDTNAVVDRYNAAIAVADAVSKRCTFLHDKLKNADTRAGQLRKFAQMRATSSASDLPTVGPVELWIDIAVEPVTRAYARMQEAKALIDEAYKSVSSLRGFRGHVLDESTYGRRLEQAKTKAQRKQLKETQHERRLVLSSMHNAVQKFDVELLDMRNLLIDAGERLASMTEDQHLRGDRDNLIANYLLLWYVIEKVSAAIDHIFEETREHRDLYAMVEDVALEDFRAEKKA